MMQRMRNDEESQASVVPTHLIVYSEISKKNIDLTWSLLGASGFSAAADGAGIIRAA